MEKKKNSKKYWIIVICITFIIFWVLVFFGFFRFLFPECGYWDAFGGPWKSCECIGIKTGGCPPYMTCDGGTYGCIGMCTNCTCKIFDRENPRGKEVPCEQIKNRSILQ
jgi:hypothetical protein